VTPARCFLALLLGLSSSQALADPQGWDPGAFMGVEEVQPGMLGTGRTVLRGSEIVEFEVEVLGIFRTPVPRGELILVRVSGQGIEKSGISAGMSGSPVYLDGRLAGALAFTWSFATEPIAGVTPIGEMLDLGARWAGVDGSLSEPRGASAGLSPGAWNTLLDAEPGDVLDILLSGSPKVADGLRPLQVPLSLGGWTAEASGLLETVLAGSDFMPVQGGAMGETPGGGTPLMAGSAVGVELVRGDAQLAAIGTVTWTDGRRVLAFGHPMLGRGASSYPMTEARIVTVLPRLSSSFKVGVVGNPLGAITRDYRAGIMGEIGGRSEMIPVTVSLNFGEREERFRFEILEATGLTPALAGLLAVNAMSSAGRAEGPGTMRVRTRIALADGREIAAENVLAGFSPPGELAGEVARLVGLVHGNPFEEVRLRSVDVEAAIDDDIQAAYLVRAAAGSGPFHAGATVPVTLWLRDYRGSETQHATSFTIPGDVGPGTYRLTACAGDEDAELERQRAPGEYLPRSLDRLVSILSESAPYDALVMRLVGTSPNPVVGGRELPRLPTSLKTLMITPQAGGRASTATATVLGVRTERLGKVILGCQTLSLTVEPRR